MYFFCRASSRNCCNSLAVVAEAVTSNRKRSAILVNTHGAAGVIWMEGDAIESRRS